MYVVEKLKYTDDPDVIHVSESQQDGSEEENQRVERLFAALEGRPRSLSQTGNQCHVTTYRDVLSCSCAITL